MNWGTQSSSHGVHCTARHERRRILELPASGERRLVEEDVAPVGEPRSSVSSLQPLDDRMRGLISRIGFDAGTFWPAAFSMRSRCVLIPCSSLTRHDGESVSRLVVRTALARSSSAVCIARGAALCSSASSLVAAVRRLAAELAQIEAALGDRLQRLAVELGEQRHHPLVDAVVHQQHFDAELAEDLEVRAVAGRGEAVGGDVVDRRPGRPSSGST